MKHCIKMLLVFNLIFVQMHSQETVLTWTNSMILNCLNVHEDNLYVSSQAIYSIDLTQPLPINDPSIFVNSSSTISSVEIQGADLYYSDAINVIRKTSLQDLTVQEVIFDFSSITIDGFIIYDLAISGSILYVAGQSIFSPSSTSAEIYSIDLQSPNPTATLLWFGQDRVTSIGIQDGFIYGVLYDISNLTTRLSKGDINQPILQMDDVVNDLQTFGSTVDLSLDAGFAYVTDFSGDRIFRLDLMDPAPPFETVMSIEKPLRCDLDGTYIYGSELIQDRVLRTQLTPAFPSMPAICGLGVATLGGASPSGGIYTGPGVTDNGDGVSFSFDPVAAGGVGGPYTITYQVGGMSATADISVSLPPTVQTSSTDSDNSINGTATAAPSGGQPPYEYLWNDAASQTTQTATGLNAGVYEVIVTDANGCTATSSVAVNQTVPIPQLTSVWCNNDVLTTDIINCTWDNANRPEAFQWRFTDTSTNTVYGPYENFGGDLSLPVFPMENFPEIVPGVTYDVEIRNRFSDGSFSEYGPSCQITIVHAISGLEQGFVGGSFELCKVVKASSVGVASSYRWRFEDQNSSAVYERTTGGRIIQLGSIPGLDAPTTYNVEVFATTGGVESQSTISTLSTLIKPTQINPATANCGGVQNIGSSAQAINVCGADSYVFEFDEVNGSGFFTVVRPNRVITFNDPQLTPGEWEITVFATYYANQGQASNSCILDFVDPNYAAIQEIEGEGNPLTRMTEVKAYPNPITRGQEMTVDITGLDPEDRQLQLLVFDLSGKLVWQENHTSSSSDYSASLPGFSSLTKGFYMLQVLSNEKLLSAQKLLLQ
jgi:hypothetical protein